MPSDDERREVAERLRAQARTAVNGWRLGDVVDASYVFYNDVLSRLADLIDRPTCQMKSNPISRYRVCSRCGAFVSEDAVTDCVKTIHIRFCPNCGAGVVSDDDQR